MQSKPEVLFLLGGPGSGKGTLANDLVKKYNFVHMSAGDLLRAEVKRGEGMAEEINGYMTNGQLVPGEVTVRLIRKAMEENGWGKSRFLLDGFPRSIGNWESWQEVMLEDADVKGVLCLNCSEEIMTSRILARAKTSGRADDNEETLKKRFKVNQEQTEPILQVFREKGQVYDIDANGSIQESRDNAFSLLDQLGLFAANQGAKVSSVREYLKSHVDPYVKPMMTDLMKEKPADVHSFMLDWLNSKGFEIKEARDSS